MLLLVLRLTLLLLASLRLVSCLTQMLLLLLLLLLMLLLLVVRIVGVRRHNRSCHDGSPCRSAFSTCGLRRCRLHRTTVPLFPAR